MYLVVRRALDSHGRACEDQSGNDTGSRVPLRLFATRASADSFAAKLELEARRTMNPFHVIGGAVRREVVEQLERLDWPVAVPEERWHEDWKAWWDLCQDLITDEQRAAVWAVLEADPTFEVTALEVDDE